MVFSRRFPIYCQIQSTRYSSARLQTLSRLMGYKDASGPAPSCVAGVVPDACRTLTSCQPGSLPQRPPGTLMSPLNTRCLFIRVFNPGIQQTRFNSYTSLLAESPRSRPSWTLHGTSASAQLLHTARTCCLVAHTAQRLRR